MIKAVSVVAMGAVSFVSVVSALFAQQSSDLVAPLLTAVVAAFTAWLTWRNKRTESALAATQNQQSGHAQLIALLQAENARHNAETSRLRGQVSAMFGLILRYQAGVAALVAQLETVGVEPSWRPDAADADRLERFLRVSGDA